MCEKIIKELEQIAEPAFAQWLKPFINWTEESGEIVLGVRVPKLRKLAKTYKNLDMQLLQELLDSNIHEARALAVFIMLIQVKKEPKKICDLYLKNLNNINNWDLIDYSAPHIGAPNVEIKILKVLSNSDYLWANRVAMVSTIYYIKQDDYELALDFAEKYITHKHHLMHKAAGWMLREIGKRNMEVLKDFLFKNSDKMPAVMRSYAMEKLIKYS